MPSTNKTPHFGLNNWSGTDKPKRTDFTEDNLRLDSLLQTHFTDTDLHFTPEDRERFAQAYVSGFYNGTGAASKSFSLSFSPSGFFVFQVGAPLSGYDRELGAVQVNSGFVSSHGGSAGIALTGQEVTLKQSQGTSEADGVFLNLNQAGKMYGYLAIR
ncbi:MAG: hypothetical protein HFJ84_02235 [Clostridiales bacterium]|nr:hypothetical protein [Clostridiales bacterium]